MDAMSMPCHLLQVCVQGAGVGQEKLQLAFPTPQTRLHENADYIYRNALITLINAVAVPESARL
jgi:hypothetical protein